MTMTDYEVRSGSNKSAAVPGKLNDLERRAVDAYKRQRMALTEVPSQTQQQRGGAESVLFASDAGLRRSLDRVLDREAELLRLQSSFLETDTHEKEEQCVQQELRRDRGQELLNCFIPRKHASLQVLREMLIDLSTRMELRRAGASSAAVTSRLNAIVHPKSNSTPDTGGTASFVLSAIKSATSLRSDSGLLSGVESILSSCDLDRANSAPSSSHLLELELHRAQARAAIAAASTSSEVSVEGQWIEWAKMASEMACLRRKIEIDRDARPDVLDLKRRLDQENSNRQAQRDERTRQFVAEKDALETAHRNVFQARKQLVSVHRRLTEWSKNASSTPAPTRLKAQQVLERLKNELTLGTVDYLMKLCEAGGLEEEMGVIETSFARTDRLDGGSSRVEPAGGSASRSQQPFHPTTTGTFQVTF